MFPLTELIRCNPKAKELKLSEKEISAFNEIKTILCEISALPHPTVGATQYQLVTDSSQYAVGAALHQMIGPNAVPIGFFSKKLSQAQTKYSAFDRELLAAYLAVLHFRHQIEGRHVVLMTDHKPLCSAFSSLKPAKSDRQQRHLALLTEYLAEVVHVQGSQNVVTDCLSRPANAACIDICDLPELARLQIDDVETQENKNKLKKIKIDHENFILFDISTPYTRPFVSVEARRSVFYSLHSLSHPGIKCTLNLIKTRYYWPDMDRTIRMWCRECLSCQQAKVHRYTKSPLQTFSLPSRFQTVHVDIVGPLPAVRSPDDPHISPYRYLLTCVDRATRWIEVQPLSNISAESYSLWFCCSVGVAVGSATPCDYR